MRQLTILLTLSILLVHVSTTSAAWPENGLLVNDATNESFLTGIVSDGAGGGIIAWFDNRNGPTDVFVQRIDASGNALWGANGVAVCLESGQQAQIAIAADNAGGAFIVWQDQRSGQSDIYAQHVQSDGGMAWQANGKPVCTAANTQAFPEVSSEGTFLLVTWKDDRNTVTTLADIYAQRLNSNGDPVWAINGVAVCTATGPQDKPKIISDGASGAIVCWEDSRNAFPNVYANHVNFLGTPDWAATGIPITNDTNIHSDVTIESDGQAGAIIAWVTVGIPNIAAQRLGPDGSSVWPAIVIATAEPLFGSLLSAPDGSGGVILTWRDFRSGIDPDAYAQRITAVGTRMWGISGTAVSTEAGTQVPVDMVADGKGGAVVLFRDDRLVHNKNDFYAQHMSANGTPEWIDGGVAITTGPGMSTVDYVQGALASDGAIIAAITNYTGDFIGYAQRIEPRYGWWGKPEPSILSVADNPGDQGGQVVVSWSASERDNLTQQEITHYSLWRATEVAPSASSAQDAQDARAADYGKPFVTLEDVGPDFSGKAVREGAFMGTAYLWELVTTQQALFVPGYSDLVATRQDSTGGNAQKHYFQVVAHTADSQVFFPSAPDSGSSVDNLAPAAPLSLIAARAGGANVDLDWSASGAGEPDFKEYWIYRGTTSGFPTDPANFLTSTPDTMATDTGASTSSAWYYKVVAVDVHDNPSDDSNEASVGAIPTGIGDRTPALSVLTVQNYPNPFGLNTAVRIGLPAASQVTVSVFDVAGKRVATRELGVMAAGYQTLNFSGRDAAGQPLPSGVYFYRVTAGGEVATRKMVIQR